MQIRKIALGMSLMGSVAGMVFGQIPAGAQVAASQPAAGQKVSADLQPALDGLHQKIQSLHLEKWKGGSVRSEAERNISSIMHDLEGPLPPLLQSADAAPASVSALLPVSRNLDALYAVVLRVFDGARVAAPGEQVDALQQAMSGLDNARHGLADRMAAAADAQEKQVGELQAKLRAQVVPVCPVPPPPPVCPTPKKTVKKKAKPAAPAQPSTAPNGGAAKPNQ